MVLGTTYKTGVQKFTYLSNHGLVKPISLYDLSKLQIVYLPTNAPLAKKRMYDCSI